jgi:Mrp family chromosome partitioning ATPase/capsular polysaccharide biosynthesis protein
VEPIDYLRAPIRRWPAVVVAALVGAIVAVLVPVHTGVTYPTDMWETPATVGLPPAYPANALGANVGTRQLAYYAHSPVVLESAAQSVGVTVTTQLKNDVVVSKPTKAAAAGIGLSTVAVLQPTKEEAAKLTNAYVQALGSYVQLQLQDQYNKQLAKLTTEITNLEVAINTLPHGTITTLPTTPTTAPPAKVKIIKIRPAPTTSSAPTTTTPPSTTTSSSTTTTTAAGPEAGPATPPAHTVAAIGSARPRDVLVATSPSSSTPTSVISTPGSSTPGSSTPAAGGTTGSTTATSLPSTATSIPGRAIAEERRVLANELGQVQASLAALKATGVPVSGYQVVSNAHPHNAVLIPGGAPLLAHRSIRFLLGLLLGALVGVAITWLLEGLDRRLRTAGRVEDTMGLPVIVEIPESADGAKSVVPVVDVVVDPYSPVSEAYRALHVAIRTAPLVTWVQNGAPVPDIVLPPVRPRVLDPVMAGPAPTGPLTVPVPVRPDVPSEGDGPDDGGPPGGGPPDGGPVGRDPTIALPAVPVPMPGGPGTGLVARRPGRFAILVTSPTDEPSRSLVVVNLAAVFAEAGERVLVATTGGMRTMIEGSQGPLLSDEPLGDQPDAATLVANARPSQLRGVSSLALGQIFSTPSRLAIQTGELVEAARQVVDVLLLEAPLLTTQDAAAMLPAVDVVVVVAESWRTTVADARRTQRLLAQRRPPVLGAVLTGTRPPNAPRFSRH